MFLGPKNYKTIYPIYVNEDLIEALEHMTPSQ